MRAAIVLMMFLVACTDASDGGGGDDGFSVDLDVTSEVPFTELLVFEPGQATIGPGVLTPALRAAGVPAPDSATFVVMESLRGDGGGAPVTEYQLHRWDLGGGPSRLNIAAIAKQPSGAFVPVAYAAVQLTWHGGEASGTLPLPTLTGPGEVWGAANAGCVRMVDDDTGATTYLVDRDDVDCDGIPDTDDCQPNAFCDASTPTELAACRMSLGGC